jgi:succinate dehydrogenase / fumarate reductase cytochrome b subunit
MVASIPVWAFLFDRAMSGPAGFAFAGAFLDHWLVRLVLLVLAWSLLHHLFAGIRYLLLAVHIGLDRQTSRRSAAGTFVAALVALGLIVLLGAVR